MRFHFAIAIAAIWGISYVVSSASGDYRGFELVTPVMLLAMTWLFAAGIRRNGGT